MKIITKILLTFFSIFIILVGLLDILTGWWYLAGTAYLDAGSQILNKMAITNAQPSQPLENSKEPTKISFLIQKTISEWKHSSLILSLMSLLFLILGPLVVAVGVMIFYHKGRWFSFFIAIGQIGVECLSSIFFSGWGIVNFITIVLSSIIIIYCIKNICKKIN